MESTHSLKPLNKLTQHYNLGKHKLFIKELHNLIKKNKKIKVCSFKLQKTEEELEEVFKGTADIKGAVFSEGDVRIMMEAADIKFVSDDRNIITPLNTHEIAYSQLKTQYDGPFMLSSFQFCKGEFFIKEIHNETALTAKTIVDALKMHVVGQDDALKNLAATWLTFNAISDINYSNHTDIPKPNVLMQGNTGCGKTFMTKKLAELLEVPFINFDASRITAEGYVGGSIEDAMVMYYEALVETQSSDTEPAIILLDEIDKLCVQSKDKSNVGTYGAQRNILKVLESDKYFFDDHSRRNYKTPPSIRTDNVMFILAGSFSSYIEDQTGKAQKRGIGFVDNTDEVQTDVISNEQLIKAGLLPELVGRIGRIIKVNDLNEDSMMDILTYGPNSLETQFSVIASNMGYEFSLKTGCRRDILNKAKKLNLGVRGLKIVAEEYFIKEINRNIYGE